MYITIKNIEALQNHLQKQGKPLKGVVVDLEKVVDQDFTQLFFDACEEYSEVNENIKKATETTKPCENCKYFRLRLDQEPCKSCFDPDYLTFDKKPDYDSKLEDVVLYDEEAEKSYLKEVTERMKSEFDATGKDTKYFMENKNIKPKFRVEHKMIESNEVKKVLICPFCDTKYDDLFGTSKIYNGSWTKCNFCGNDVYIPEEV